MRYKSDLKYQFSAYSQSRIIQRAAASSFTLCWPTPNHFVIAVLKKCFSQELQAQTCWLKLLQRWFTLVFTQWLLQKIVLPNMIVLWEYIPACIMFALSFNGLINRWRVMPGNSSQWLCRAVSWTWRVLFNTILIINQLSQKLPFT